MVGARDNVMPKMVSVESKLMSAKNEPGYGYNGRINAIRERRISVYGGFSFSFLRLTFRYYLPGSRRCNSISTLDHFGIFG